MLVSNDCSVFGFFLFLWNEKFPVATVACSQGLARKESARESWTLYYGVRDRIVPLIVPTDSSH